MHLLSRLDTVPAAVGAAALFRAPVRCPAVVACVGDGRVLVSLVHADLCAVPHTAGRSTPPAVAEMHVFLEGVAGTGLATVAGGDAEVVTLAEVNRPRLCFVEMHRVRTVSRASVNPARHQAPLAPAVVLHHGRVLLAEARQLAPGLSTLFVALLCGRSETDTPLLAELASVVVASSWPVRLFSIVPPTQSARSLGVVWRLGQLTSWTC
mmetsp:Transcript_23308/g.54443  ORF Transcript_23308/g.54443 Transcript_23308/m.54443 type:complete len:209 (+) Transcript_23308:1082-1708(+)